MPACQPASQLQREREMQCTSFDKGLKDAGMTAQCHTMCRVREQCQPAGRRPEEATGAPRNGGAWKLPQHAD